MRSIPIQKPAGILSLQYRPGGVSGDGRTADPRWRSSSRSSSCRCSRPPRHRRVRSEFYGIVQGPTNEQDCQGMETPKVRTDRILLNWRDIETRPRASAIGPDRITPSAPSPRTASGLLPFVWGSPQWVGNGTLAQPPTGHRRRQAAWQNFLRAAVARYGPGRHLLGQRLPPAAPGRHPAPGHRLAGLERAQPEEVLLPGANVQASAKKYATLLQLSHDAIRTVDPSGDDRARRNADRRGLDGRRVPR